MLFQPALHLNVTNMQYLSPLPGILQDLFLQRTHDLCGRESVYRLDNSFITVTGAELVM